MIPRKTHNATYTKINKTSDELVVLCENTCAIIESDDFFKSFVLNNSLKKFSINTTVANVRLYYFVSAQHECASTEHRAYEKLTFLLNEDSWSNLYEDGKKCLFEKNPEILNHVFCFV